MPILALTATAAPQVLRDVEEILGLKPSAVRFRGGSDRRNLYFEVRPKPPAKDDAVDALLSFIDEGEGARAATGIVYCLSQKECYEVAEGLRRRGGLTAAPYHAGLADDDKRRVHDAWRSGGLACVCATIAFGLGIDKPDVRYVAHYTVSKALESYYQEAGRAGRDGARARCCLFYRAADLWRIYSLTATEASGADKATAMAAYCGPTIACRRAALSEALGDAPPEPRAAADCCDACLRAEATRGRGSDDTASRDRALDLARRFATVAAEADADAGAPRRTAKALVDEVRRRADRGSDAKAIHKEDLELFCAQLTVAKILALDLHFTAYSVVVYLKKGRRANALLARSKTDFDLALPSMPSTKTKPKAKDVIDLSADDDDGDPRKRRRTQADTDDSDDAEGCQ